MKTASNDVVTSSNNQNTILFCSLIVFLVSIIYYNALFGAFIWDDRAAIIANNDVKGITPIDAILSHDFWGQDIKLSDSHKSYRPLTTLTFRLDHSIFGFSAYGYHFTNILIYFVTCLMMFAVSQQWFQLQAAQLATILFVVHPVHVEAVSSIVGRADCLCGLLFLTAIYFYTTSVRDKSSMWILYFVLSLIASFSACFAKEIGVTVFTVMVVIEILEQLKPIVWKHKAYKFQHQNSVSTTATVAVDCEHRIGYFTNPSWNISFQLIIRCFHTLIANTTSLLRIGILLLSLIVFFQFRYWLHGKHALYEWTMMENHIALSPSFTSRAFSYAQSHFWYVFKLCYPKYLCFDYGYDCIPMVHSLWDIRNIFPMIIYGGFIALIVHTLQHMRISLMLGLATFILPLIPALNIFVAVGTVLAERLLFIPSIGFCWVITEVLLYDCKGYWDGWDSWLTESYESYYIPLKQWVEKLSAGKTVDKSPTTISPSGPPSLTSPPRKPKNTSVVKVPKPSSLYFHSFYIFFVPLIIACMSRVITRNEDWKSEINIYSSALRVCPRSVKALSNYALLVLTKGEIEKGTITALKAVELFPNHTAGFVNAGVAYQRARQLLPSIELYEYALGNSLRGDTDGSGGQSPLKALGYLGNSLYSWANQIPDKVLAKGIIGQAIYWLEEGMRLGFKAPAILHLAGSAAFDVGNIPLAIKFYENALEEAELRRQARKGSADVPIEDDINIMYTYNQLGNCYTDLRKVDEAIFYYEQGLKHDPHSVAILSNLSILYKEIKQYEKARKVLLAGIEATKDTIAPGSLYNNLGTLELEVGNYPLALQYFEKALTCVRLNQNARTYSIDGGNDYRYDVEGDNVETVILNNMADTRARMKQ